ncbi:MAG: DUF2141 domain-containing protein [Bdellovibrionaceae bacterium]|nr:DUF2141 domain-containing protein [Pseudobdellovibrionaceae bacterium]
MSHGTPTLALLATLMSAATVEAATLNLQINSIRNDRGSVLVSLYDRADGFPDDPEAALHVRKVKARAGEMTIVFRDLAPGTYAVAFIHDENDNGKLDTNLIGIPKEGFGFSNDPRLRFGPPPFSASAFELRVPGGTANVKMKYF